MTGPGPNRDRDVRGVRRARSLVIRRLGRRRTKTRADFYAAGGGVSGFRNGLAIAGDYMSAASFLGISSQIFGVGYDGLIYSIGFLVGWPLILFLMAERLRNLGKYTFADVASPVSPAAGPECGGLDARRRALLPDRADGRRRAADQIAVPPRCLAYAVLIVGVLMTLYVLFGGMIATTWVQVIKAVLLLGCATIMAFAVLAQFGFSPEALFARAVELKANLAAAGGMGPEQAYRQGPLHHGAGTFLTDPISAISFGMALMFGTGPLHILMRFFTVPPTPPGAHVGALGTGWIGYFYILTFIIGFGAIILIGNNPAWVDATGALPATPDAKSISPRRWAATSSWASSRPSPSRRSWRSSQA